MSLYREPCRGILHPLRPEEMGMGKVFPLLFPRYLMPCFFSNPIGMGFSTGPSEISRPHAGTQCCFPQALKLQENHFNFLPNNSLTTH